jgi:hypothetical protein
MGKLFHPDKRERWKEVVFRRVMPALTLLALAVGALAAWWAFRMFSRPARSSEARELFHGVHYERTVSDAPRKVTVHKVRVDLDAGGIGFVVTRGDASGGRDVLARTTSEFLKEFDAQLAINGAFFEPFHSNHPLDYYPESGEAVDVLGRAVANGELYSDDNQDWPTLCLSSNRVEIALGELPVGVRWAVAGRHLLVDQGKAVESKGDTFNVELHPRTAVGVDEKGGTLWLVVVDGRQENYSEGATLKEVASLMVHLGAWRALNLDGGGSSTLVVEGADGEAEVLNAPYHTRVPMRERPVANHVGVFARSVE